MLHSLPASPLFCERQVIRRCDDIEKRAARFHSPAEAFGK